MRSSPVPIYLNQAMVSGGNFLTGLVLVRALGLEQFGVYSMLFVVTLLITTTHNALFSAPMLTIVPSISETERIRYLGALNLVQSIGCVFVFIAILVITHILCNWWPGLSGYAVPLAASSALIPVQEWQRRYLIATEEVMDAVIHEGFRLILLFSTLGIYFLHGTLTVSTALLTLALSSGITYALSFFGHTPGLLLASAAKALQQNWSHARHLMPSYQLEWASLQGFLIVAGALLGSQAAGAIRAAQNILGPLNIAYQAADNIYPAAGARVLSRDGVPALNAYFMRSARRGLIALGIPCALIAYYADEIMLFVYGTGVSAFGSLVIWQAASLLLGFSFKLMTAYLRVTGSTRPVLNATMVGVFFTYVLIFPFGIHFSADGIMLAKLISESLAIGFIGYFLAGIIRR